MAILSQLFWGVTIGALGAAFEVLTKGALGIAALGGAGWYARKWQTRRRNQKAASSAKVGSTKDAPSPPSQKDDA